MWRATVFGSEHTSCPEYGLKATAMIIENAFGYMPEILTGSNYAVQRYEGGIVTAVALAVLQELNARNVVNPLSSICVEKLYNQDGYDRGVDASKKRYLRADVYVDLSRLSVGSDGLSRFGWRHKNWLEAKYFRKGKIPSTIACAHMAADLIRLCALAPSEYRSAGEKKFTEPRTEQKSRYERLCTGRYFLHVYDSAPEDLVGKSGRPWVKILRTPGQHKVEFVLGQDSAKKEFVDRVGEQLSTLEVSLEVTNFCRAQKPGATEYFCALSRIDAFRISMDDAGTKLVWDEKDDRTAVQSPVDAWTSISRRVGAFVLLGDKKREDRDDEPPSSDELGQPPVDDGT